MFFKRSYTYIVLLALPVVLALLSSPPAAANEPDHRSTENVYWWWDGETVVGSSALTRTPNGISANLETSGVPAGQAMTLWFIVFNNPAGCASSPCSVPEDVFNPAAQADFLVGAGHVTGSGPTATFSGQLSVGDTSGSGMPEVGLPELALGLLDPMNAEVMLALHSHGPAMTGQTLADQISSFTGGCSVFLGSNGFATGPADIPANPGECATFQRSVHQP
jgi:hypothetical protein